MTRRNMTEQDNTQLEQSTIVISDQTADTAKWYVVHTYAGHERKVALTLKQRVESAGMQNKVFKVLVPTQKKIVISEGKKRNIDERLFPGYIIVNMALDDESWYMVRSTRGTKPTPLPETEVNTLMKFMRMEAPKFEAKFSLGDAVRITDGPFTDFLGKVDEVNHEQGKVKVLVSVFGRETPVELDFLQVTGI